MCMPSRRAGCCVGSRRQLSRRVCMGPSGQRMSMMSRMPFLGATKSVNQLRRRVRLVFLELIETEDSDKHVDKDGNDEEIDAHADKIAVQDFCRSDFERRSL